MKRTLLSLLLFAFAVSFSPLAMAAAPEATLAKEELPIFKKNSKARYIQIKRKNGSYVKKSSARKKKSIW